MAALAERTGEAMRRKLQTTLGLVRAVRAASPPREPGANAAGYRRASLAALLGGQYAIEDTERGEDGLLTDLLKELAG
jgi:hypothetical protein